MYVDMSLRNVSNVSAQSIESKRIRLSHGTQQYLWVMFRFIFIPRIGVTATKINETNKIASLLCTIRACICSMFNVQCSNLTHYVQIFTKMAHKSNEKEIKRTRNNGQTKNWLGTRHAHFVCFIQSRINEIKQLTTTAITSSCYIHKRWKVRNKQRKTFPKKNIQFNSYVYRASCVYICIWFAHEWMNSEQVLKYKMNV